MAVGFVCTECHRSVHNPYEQFTERMEYRRVDSMERRLSYAVRDVCRDCVDVFAARRKNPSGAVQGKLGI